MEVDIREGLLKAKLKAAAYYGKTKGPRGVLFGIGACLNPYCKLNGFRKWDIDDTSGETAYDKSYKKEFIGYNDLYYAPMNAQGPDTPIPRSGQNSQSKYLHGSRPRAIMICETLGYLESDSEIEPRIRPPKISIPGMTRAQLGFSTRQIFCSGGRLRLGDFRIYLEWLGIFLRSKAGVSEQSAYLAWQEM